MVNPEKEEFFCQKINKNCVGRECLALQEETFEWYNLTSIGDRKLYRKNIFSAVIMMRFRFR